ncbi:hypothetical protein ACTVJH_09285 [Desulfoplanes sp. PS50]
MKKLTTRILYLFAFVCIAWSMSISFKHAASQAHCSTKRNSTLKRIKQPEKQSIKRAIELSPHNGVFHYKLARAIGSQEALLDKHRAALEKALALNPLEGRWWRRLGSTYATLGYQKPSVRNRFYGQAGMAFTMAAHLRPRDGETLFQSAKYWMWRSKTPIAESPQPLTHPLANIFNSLPKKRSDSLNLSKTLFHHSLALSGRNWKKALSYTARLYPDSSTMLSVIPPENAKLRTRAANWITTWLKQQTTN